MGAQKYGVTPWGKWFVEALDGYGVGERLNRGRSYANTGKVLSLDIKGGAVSAKVKGHYSPFYRVSITFSPLSEADCKRIAEIMAEEPEILSSLSAHVLSEGFLKKLKTEKIPLIPKRWVEMKRTCNCPDIGDPCKHMAAIYFVLAREIDANPFLLFQLRGVDLEELAKKFSLKLDDSIAPPFSVKERPKNAENTAPLPQNAPGFPEIPLCSPLILSLLPPHAPFFAGKQEDFTGALAEFYHHASRFELYEDAASFLPESELENEEKVCARSHWSLKVTGKAEPGAKIKLVRTAFSGEQAEYGVFDAYSRFRRFSSEDGDSNYRFLFFLFKFLGLLCDSGAFAPAPLVSEAENKGGKGGKKQTLRIIWLPFTHLPEIEKFLGELASYENKMLRLKAGVYAEPRGVIDMLSSALLSEYVRRNYFTASSRARKPGPAAVRDISGLFFDGEAVDVSAPALRSLPRSIANWVSVLYTDFNAYNYRFTLKEARASAKKDNKVEFSLSLDVLLEEGNAMKPVPLKDAAQKTGTLEVLKAPTALANYLPEIRRLFAQKEVRLSEERLTGFLDDACEILRQLGITVALPKNLRRDLKPRLIMQADTKDGAKKGGNLVTYLNLDSLLNWEWKVAIGEAVLTKEEAAMLLKEKSAVVRFRDQFVRIDPEALRGLFAESRRSAKPSITEFLKAHLGGDSLLSYDAQKILDSLFREEKNAPPASLQASLREYQSRGFNWVTSLLRSGFGCILADDMGLGKTIQSLACMLRFQEAGLLTKPSLIIAPASLLENWEREARRFAPSISLSRYHGAKRTLNTTETGFILTTYQTAVRDAAKLTSIEFSFLIVDEAHLLKNAGTRASRTVKAIPAQYRLALSGTPVENRLEDLRSLFDFVLPGFLGEPDEFRKNWRVPIEVERRADRAEALRKITAPFLLRRLKTDKTIISDLPDKIVTSEYAGLEKGQAALYESLVSETLAKSEALEKEEEREKRSALVLQLLSGLKQICDHPRVYDKESPAKSALSGKAQLLLTILREILDAGSGESCEKALVFSQYVETLECLRVIIKEELGEEALLYHGGLSQQKRNSVIDTFQNESGCRILLVSLRAGGLGLNLTAASQVIHYDLWYNPAVENQATDRAFRIGQKRTVFVHRFVTKGTFEEKIDAMLKSKSELADMAVSSGESWLARMSHAELAALFAR